MCRKVRYNTGTSIVREVAMPRFRLPTALFVFLFLALPFPAGAVDFKAALTPSYRPGELIVRFRDDTTGTQTLTAAKAAILHTFHRIKARQIMLPSGTTVTKALQQFRADPNVLYAEPNYLVHKLATPNDPLYGSQWALPLIAAPTAWNSYTGPSVVANSLIVAVLDTGVAYTHPDIKANLWTNPGEICGNGIDDDNDGIVDDCYGADFGSTTLAPGDPWDDDTADSHGTHVSGIIGAVGNNATGVSGINWTVRIMAVKFLHGPDGTGDLADALKGVDYALAKGAKIINMSFEVDATSPPQSLVDAINAADKAGVLVVAAAGNSGKDLDSATVYPASIHNANTLVVAASNAQDRLASYSDYGRHTVDLAAPGGENTGTASAVLSTVWLNNGATLYRTTAGTSMAAPMVTGAAALIWNRNPTLSPYQVKARIMNGVDQLPAFQQTDITGGRLDVAKALTGLDLPALFTVTPWQLPLSGGAVTITGVNFGATRGTVTLGVTPLTVTAWSDSSITATVPAMATSGAVYVNNSGNGFPVTIATVPSVSLTASPASGVAPLAVTLTPQITSTAAIATYQWDFGDNSSATGNGPVTHTYSTAGSYTVTLTVTDSTGQTGSGSAIVTVSSPSGGGGGGGGCFIATAAWGSYLNPKVALLRAFRDHYLLTNGPGRLFVRAYYTISPPIAEVIARHEGLRTVTRWALTPLVWSVEYPLVAFLFILLGGCAFGLSLYAMRRQMKYRG